ncbi:MAG: 16S rRNA (cytosine(1402)-N(4))-methyltransferase RsmH [Candidatus Bathyarchaeia archaeon]
MHFPVMLDEVIRFLDPKPGENFVDCTVGEGGHALAILDRNRPDGRVLGIDLSPEVLQRLRAAVEGTDYAGRLLLVHGNFSNLKSIVDNCGFSMISGVLFDLGFSAWHIEQSGRGFSLWRDEPLDMRYDPQGSLTAEAILNFWSVKDIERILRVYGEERFYRRIAREIVTSRPLKTTMDLVMAVERATPRWYHRRRIHFATRTFQALRIAVNNELENLKTALPQALEVLDRGGRLIVLSFHSLEDRIVKNFMKAKAEEGLLKVLTKKPLSPSMMEVKRNPRSRSARLRAAVKL